MSIRTIDSELIHSADLDLLADIICNSHEGTHYDRQWYSGSWMLEFGSVSAGFHIVMEGEVQLILKDGQEYSLNKGDVAMLSQSHRIGTDRNKAAKPFSQKTLQKIITRESEGEVCLLCGAYLLSNVENHLVFSNLPSLILMRAGERDLHTDTMIALLDSELKSCALGAKTVASRLIDAMLVKILRYWIETDCPRALTWLRALYNPSLSRAITLIYDEYHKNWTIESLAREAGTSRGTLARNFAAEVGTSPIQFLTERRLNVAKTMLKSGRFSLEQIAGKVGYSSAFALSKAFKRKFGQAPAFYMKSQTHP